MKTFEAVWVWRESENLIYCEAENKTEAEHKCKLDYPDGEIIYLHEIKWKVEKEWTAKLVESRLEALERFIEDEAGRYKCQENYLIDHFQDPALAFRLQEAVWRVWRFLREGDPEVK